MGYIKNAGKFLFGILLIVYAAYALLFIYKNMVVFDGKPYFGLFDDSMISMTYARNLAQGNGLVWNAGGERVEGISNPLWTVYMAFYHLFPIPVNLTSLPIQLSGAVFLILNLIFVKKIVDAYTGGSTVPALAAVLLTAFYYPINNWSLLGTEVGILTLVTTLTAWMMLNSLKSQKFSPAIYLILGTASLVRMDMLLLGVVTWGFLLLADSKNRRKNLLWGLVILGGFSLAQTLLRLWYYGDVLPNTYYLKMANGILSLRLERGLYVFIKFVMNFNMVLFLVPLLFLIFRRDKLTWYLFVIFGVYVAYSIYVGGDAWEHRGGSNRFFTIVMPVYFILFALSIDSIRQAILEKINSVKPVPHPRLRLAVSHGGMVFFILLSLFYFNSLIDFHSWDYVLLRKPSDLNGLQKALVLSNFIQKITTPDATILVIGAGGIPYFSERYSYDLLGKSDRVIAHEPVRPPDGVSLLNWRPGHNKWDYNRSILEQKPDVIPELWWQVPWDQTLKYLGDYSRIQIETLKDYLPDGVLWVRKGSPNIRWELIQQDIVPG